MDWIQFIIFIGSTVGLFFWNRTESRTDIRHMDSKLESNRNLTIEIHRENQAIIDSIRRENKIIIDAIHQDMKEFRIRMERQDAEFKAFMMNSNKK